MSATKKPGKRSLYYDAILIVLENDIKPEINSARALHAYKYVRRQIARLAAINAYAPLLPESLASLHPESEKTQETPRSDDAINAALIQEGRLLDEIEAATDARIEPRVNVTAETTTSLPEKINDQSVQDYLRENLDPEIRVNNLRILNGGRSKQTILFATTDRTGKDTDLVIRRDLSTSATGGMVSDEYPVLKALAGHNFPVPYPILCEPDASKFGSSLIIVKRVSGQLEGHLFDPPSYAAVLDSARVLARLHSLPAAEIAPSIREKFRFAPTVKQIRALVLEFQETWEQNSRARSVTVDFAFKWMLEAIDFLNPLTAVVHGDYSYHNILFENDKLTAVLDWELVRIGHPAEDLAFVRAAVLKRMTWATFMAAYYDAGGPAIDVKDQMFYTLLEKLRLILMLFNARLYVEDGSTDDIEFVDAVVYAVPRLVHHISMEIRNYLGLAS